MTRLHVVCGPVRAVAHAHDDRQRPRDAGGQQAALGHEVLGSFVLVGVSLPEAGAAAPQTLLTPSVSSSQQGRSPRASCAQHASASSSAAVVCHQWHQSLPVTRRSRAQEQEPESAGRAARQRRVAHPRLRSHFDDVAVRSISSGRLLPGPSGPGQGAGGGRAHTRPRRHPCRSQQLTRAPRGMLPGTRTTAGHHGNAPQLRMPRRCNQRSGAVACRRLCPTHLFDGGLHSEQQHCFLRALRAHSSLATCIIVYAVRSYSGD